MAKEGTPNHSELEAKAKAGITKRKSSSGSSYLDKVREEIVKAYSPEYIAQHVGELIEAKTETVNREGMTIRSTNFKAKEAGLKLALEINGMRKGGEGGGSEGEGRLAPTKIIVNVMNSQPVEVKAVPIDVKPIEPTE